MNDGTGASTVGGWRSFTGAGGGGRGVARTPQPTRGRQPGGQRPRLRQRTLWGPGASTGPGPTRSWPRSPPAGRRRHGPGQNGNRHHDTGRRLRRVLIAAGPTRAFGPGANIPDPQRRLCLRRLRGARRHAPPGAATQTGLTEGPPGLGHGQGGQGVYGRILLNSFGAPASTAPLMAVLRRGPTDGRAGGRGFPAGGRGRGGGGV